MNDSKEIINRLIEIECRHYCKLPDVCEVDCDIKSAIAALEKQIPQKPLSNGHNINKELGICECPICGAPINDFLQPKYCGECGQALLWEED